MWRFGGVMVDVYPRAAVPLVDKESFVRLVNGSLVRISKLKLG